jgi:hypothetical protein
VAEELDEANIYVWGGNYYALAVTERLGLEDSGGMDRVGPVPQNWWVTTRWRRSGGLGRRWGKSQAVKIKGINYLLAGGCKADLTADSHWV